MFPDNRVQDGKTESAAALLGGEPGIKDAVPVLFLSLIQASIWYMRSWGTTGRYMLDGFIYGVVTAATFGWLWP